MPVPFPKLPALAGLASLAAFAGVSSAHVVEMSLQHVTTTADRIVIGDVVKVTGLLDPASGVIESHVEVAVTDTLKGPQVAQIEFTLLGGTVDDRTMRTCVTPTFLEGDHVLLFLEQQPPRLVGYFQGAYLTDGQQAVQMGSGNVRFLPDLVQPLAKLLAAIDGFLPDTDLSGGVKPYQGAFSLQGGVAYTLAQCNWNYVVNPMGETFVVNPNCVDAGCGTDPDLLNALLAGAQVWTDAGAEFQFNYAGTSASTSAPAFNGQNLLRFDNASNAPGGENNPSAVAVTFFWCSGPNMTEWDMVFNDFDFNFWNGIGACSNRYDIQGTAAHEFGHTLGLGHSAISQATMFASTFPCNIGMRSLHADDIAGLVFIYGADPVPPANDTCANATTVLAGLTEFNNDGATTDGFSEACGTMADDVWFEYAATCGGEVTIDLCASSFNTSVAVYELPCPTGANEAIACNDNGCGDRSLLTFQALEGTTYLIRVGGMFGTSGNGDLDVSIVCVDPCPADTNDDGQVDVQDLSYVILNWGTADEAADVNDDHAVDVQDMTAIILAWGPC